VVERSNKQIRNAQTGHKPTSTNQRSKPAAQRARSYDTRTNRHESCGRQGARRSSTDPGAAAYPEFTYRGRARQTANSAVRSYGTHATRTRPLGSGPGQRRRVQSRSPVGTNADARVPRYRSWPWWTLTLRAPSSRRVRRIRRRCTSEQQPSRERARPTVRSPTQIHNAEARVDGDREWIYGWGWPVSTTHN